jgi:hypothetical protein
MSEVATPILTGSTYLALPSSGMKATPTFAETAAIAIPSIQTELAHTMVVLTTMRNKCRLIPKGKMVG